MKRVLRSNWPLVCLFFIARFLFCEPAAAQRQIVYGGFNASSDAVSLFNQGTALLRSNHNQEAKEKFERAISLSPNFAEAHHELAVALLKLDRRDDAINQFQQAIKLDPGLAASWLSLAGAYQASGRVTEAISSYRDFLSKFPNDDDVPRVRNLIAMLEKENSEAVNGAAVTTNQAAQLPGSSAPKTSDATLPGIRPNSEADSLSNDYLSCVTRMGKIFWPTARMPLHVFIDKGDLIPGYRPEFATILKDAFLEWGEASQGLVSFVFVDAAPHAEIVCRWTANMQKFKNSAEAAETKLYSDRKGVARGEMEILTMPPPSSPPLTDMRLRGTALHEVGHILGLAGHTRNPDDIMFFSSSPADSWKDLSARDKNTLIRLYKEQ